VIGENSDVRRSILAREDEKMNGSFWV